MNRPHQQIQELFDGDPHRFVEYHQDYREGIYSSYRNPGVIIALLLCCVPIVYQILYLLDYDLLPFLQLLWNIFVYLTPARFLDAVESYSNPLRITNPLKEVPRTHAAKSEAMRRVLGLDKPGGIIGSVAQAGRRRLSTLPGLNMNVHVADGRPAGLGNWDNSCYQNSVLQGLASLDSISEYLSNPKLEEAMDEKPEMKMADALHELIENLNDSSNNGKRIWTPAPLKNMSSWQQQDAQEYFSKVLDEIDKEVGKFAEAVKKSRGLESEESWKLSSSDAPSIESFRNPLEGLQAQRVGCTKCGYSEGLNLNPFNCLTVPLGKAWEYDIAECLDEYTKLEHIEGVECGKCTLLKFKRLLTTIVERNQSDSKLYDESKARLDAIDNALEEDDYEDKTLQQKCKISPKNRVTSTKTRQFAVARPPKSLVVHVNRSLFDEMTGELKKNLSMVRFPKFLDLGRWCLGSSSTTMDSTMEEWGLNPDEPMIASGRQSSRLEGPIYELRAVVTHYGRHENGHYVCYRKHPPPDLDKKGEDKQWWRLSDDDVTKVTEETVLSQGGVFMLFYDRVEPAVLKLPVTNPVEQSSAKDEHPVLQTLENVAINPPSRLEKPLNTSELPEPTLAASIPLPDIDDENLSSESDYWRESSASQESVATSISDNDDDYFLDPEHGEYQPTKAIVVPKYVGSNSNGEGVEHQNIMSPTGPLVMV